MNAVTDAIASGTISTDLPALTQLLTILLTTSVGGTSSVIGVAAGPIYVATAIYLLTLAIACANIWLWS